MGRELRRKQAKKEGKSLEREQIEKQNELKKLVIITCVLVIIMCIIYLISALFITKELDWFSKDKETTNESSVSNSILASSIFKQKEEEYYVYLYDFSEEESAITSLVTSKLSQDTVYKVDTSSAMNSKYISETSNKQAKTLEELKVIAPTLIKISGDVITEYYEKEEITNKLK